MYIIKTKQQLYDKLTYLCISSLLYSTCILDNNNFHFSFRDNVKNRYYKRDLHMNDQKRFLMKHLTTYPLQMFSIVFPGEFLQPSI